MLAQHTFKNCYLAHLIITSFTTCSTCTTCATFELARPERSRRMIFVNFKSSFEGTGQRAVRLIEKLVQAQSETPIPIIPVPHDFDIYPCLLKWKKELWIQHLDYEYGDTGRNGVEMVSDWDFPEIGGIEGTFLNHSEHKYHSWDKLKLVVEDCKKSNIKTMLFAGDISEFKLVLELKPNYVAFEPPELIASSTTSVTKAKPDEIRAVAEIAQKSGLPLIIGAGVKDIEDVKKSLELGATGVVVSSAIVLAEDPKKVVLELAKGFK